MRTCKTSGNSFCTRCCQVIGIAGYPALLQDIRTSRKSIVDGDKLVKLWKRVSKRRAKKINSYAVGRFPTRSGWFICNNLGETGCKDYDNRPNTCQTFLADESYSDTCPTDSRVFYRTGERFMSEFVKDDNGEWYLESTQYYVGTGREGVDNFYSHLITSGDMTLSDVIDQIMINVNNALSDEEVTDE